MTFSTVNPATGQKIKDYQYRTWSEAQLVVEQSYLDWQKWRKTELSERRRVLNLLASLLRIEKDSFAVLMNQEMGKSPGEALAEIEKCAITCEYYAQNGEQLLRNQIITSSPYAHAEVSFQPLGVIFSIMPWNFPLWQVIRFAAPSLMAGNVVVLKHSDLTAGTAETLGNLFEKLTTGLVLLRNLHVNHEVAAQIIAHPQVRGVTFTGSTRGGKAVAMEAAKNLKKNVLELGGSDPYIVLEDADLEKAAESCAKVRLLNCGQSCVAGKRFIVVEKVANEFIRLFQAKLKSAQLAPLAHKKFQVTIHAQVKKLEVAGGELLLGGQVPEGQGAFYPATLVLFRKNCPEIHQEEIFGPVALVVVVRDEKEALEVANSSLYGLGGGVFTKNTQKGQELVEKELQAGFVVVNDFVKSDPRIPFGGVKDSGYGRELGSFGILEFVNIKTVAIGGD